MHPLALLLFALPAYGANYYLDENTYIQEGIAKPEIGGFNARYVIGGLGLAASVLTGGVLGLIGAGAAVGSLLNAQSASKVERTYQTAAMTFQQRQIAQGRTGPVHGVIPPHEHYQAGATWLPGLMAA